MQTSWDGSYGCVAPKLCGRFGTMTLPRQSCADGRDGSYGFAVPKLYKRIGTVAKALRRQSCADDSETEAMALLRQSCADVPGR